MKNVVVNFVNSGQAGQKILDFYMDFYADVARRIRILVNGYAVSTNYYDGSSTQLYSNLDVGFSNYYHGNDASLLPTVMRISGYVESSDPTRIAFFNHMMTPFAKTDGEAHEIVCSDPSTKIKCYHYGGTPAAADDLA